MKHKHNKNKPEKTNISFFKKNITKKVLFIIILAISLSSIYVNFYNKCGGPFCTSTTNSILLAIFSAPLALFYKLSYENPTIFWILLIITICYDYVLAYLINKITTKTKDET